MSSSLIHGHSLNNQNFVDEGVITWTCCTDSLHFVADAVTAAIHYFTGEESDESLLKVENLPYTPQLADIPPKPLPASGGKIFVKFVQVSDMKNVEFMGKNDLYVKLFFESWNHKSKVKDNAGAAASWDYGDSQSFPMPTDKLSVGQMRIEVWDENSMRSDTLIGSAALSLAALANQIGSEKSFTTKVFDKSGKVAGNVSLSIIYRI